MTQFLRRAAASLALAGSFLGLAPAHAATVTVSDWAYGSGGWVIGTGSNADTRVEGPAGGFRLSLAGAGAFDAPDLLAYCVEVAEGLDFGVAMSGYALRSGAEAFGARLEGLSRLMSLVAAEPSRVDTADESTSMQLAIWELLYDTDLQLSAKGAFRDQSPFASGATQLLRQSAQQAITVDLWGLQRAGTQDLVFAVARSPQVSTSAAASAVPEPASLALALGALGLAGVARRRRSAGA